MGVTRKIVVALTLIIAMTQWAAAQVLEQVPESSLVVIKVKNLAETSGKLGAFFKELGVDQLMPELGDPLAALKKHLNIQNGLDEKGELAFVFMDPAVSGVDDDHSLVLLIPVSDYKAFTGNFADAKTEGDLTEVKFPNEPDASYVTPWGKYAAVSPSKEVLGKKPAAGVKLKGLTAKELSSKDAIVYVNMVALRAKLLPELKNNRDEMLDKVAAGLQGEREKYIPIAKSVVSQFLTIAQRYLEDASSVTYGVSFTPTGISGT